MDNVVVDYRPQRAAAIVQTKGQKVREVLAGKYLVPSQNTSGSYLVDIDAHTCTCPDFGDHGVGHRCKHQLVVAIVRHELVLPDGNTLVTEKIKIKYPRNRAAETASQREEKERSLVLLRDLFNSVVPPPYKGHGRPCLPLADKLFSAATRFLTKCSGKRVESDLRLCQRDGLIEVVPHFNTVFRVLGEPATTPILQTLIGRSAMPFIPLETRFAIDSTGFSTDTYSAYRDHRWGKDRVTREFLKSHGCFGVRTCVATAVEVNNHHDAQMWGPLLERTAGLGFSIKEVLGDAAYWARHTAESAEKHGAKPVIDYIEGRTAKGPPAYQRMYAAFMFRRPEHKEVYRFRVKAETGHSMIKTKYGGEVASRTPKDKPDEVYSTTRVNEILLKYLLHNIAVGVRAIHTLGFDGDFFPVNAERPEVPEPSTVQP
jgi:hypothetical protein